MSVILPPSVKFYGKKIVASKIKRLLIRSKGLKGYSEIKALYKQCFKSEIYPSVSLGSNDTVLHVYRITRPFPGMNVNEYKHYSYNPNADLNRANIAKYPVFYGAEDIVTAFREMKNSITPGQNIFVSKWEIKFTRDVLVHVLMCNSKTLRQNKGNVSFAAKRHMKSLGFITRQYPVYLQAGIKQLIVKMGDLFTRAGDHNYYLTSAYAHRILYEGRSKNPNLCISALAYPSVATENISINYAIHPDVIDTMGTLKGVLLVEVGKNDSGFIKEKGMIGITGKIDWQKPSISIKSIDSYKITLAAPLDLTGVSISNVLINNDPDYNLDMLLRDTVMSSLKTLNVSPFGEDAFDFGPRESQHEKTYNTNGMLKLCYNEVETTLHTLRIKFTIIQY